ncbi:hypothetical protein L873DRAFT_1703376 [Choiromyces venosus 120613-1]|uniref:Uncharacterized protein n=1 Tax=Choiromyces venosus 120613-1 TaxID=1336337 RepID=A0A3N4JB16_9PEZI|nr:hypothetical protein L873DRAFT_1703376 [Choiromyces venosus 120613-1]
MEKSGKFDSHDGVNAGGTNKNTGTDDDEDLDRGRVDRGGGNFGLGVPQAIERIRIEQVRRKSTHRRHQQLHVRQNGVVSGITDLVGDNVPTVLPSIASTATTLPTLTSSLSLLIPELSSLSIPSSTPGTVVPSISPSDSTDYPNVPVGSTQQTVLSSTPPPSPAETSPGMVIPITISGIFSGSLLKTESPLPSPSSPSLSSSTIVSLPSTTVTSYWPSLITKNGTTTSDTRTASTTTIDGNVIVYTSSPLPTGFNNSTLSRNVTSSSTPLSSSSWSLNSTTTTSSSSTSSYSSKSTWPATTDLGGGGGGGVAPTNTAPSVSPTPTESSGGGGGAPVSPRLLGGVLGGVAGVALILLAVLYFMRRYKEDLAIQERNDAGYDEPVMPTGEQAMAAVAGGRSFYKVSGRKLPPVIGGPRPGEFSSTRSAAGSSYYHDDEISWIGPGTPVSSTGAGPSRYSGVSGGTPSSPTSSSAPGSATTPVGPAPILPLTSTAISTGPSRIPEERESDPELASPSESMPPPPPPIIKPPSAPGSQTDVSLTPPIRPPFSRGMSSVSVGSAGSGKEGQAAGEVAVSAGPSILPAFARQMSAERVGSAGKDGVGRSLPSHDGSRASRFTEDIV